MRRQYHLPADTSSSGLPTIFCFAQLTLTGRASELLSRLVRANPGPARALHAPLLKLAGSSRVSATSTTGSS